MTKQEQVKEILEVIKHCGDYTKRDCAECDYRLYGECKNQKQCEAEALYNAGYRKVDDLKAENKQLKTECALLDDELRIARQETINVLNKLKTKAFDKDAFNGWAGSTFVVLVRDIDKMIEELTKCRR